jgi:hypothetical protein
MPVVDLAYTMIPNPCFSRLSSILNFTTPISYRLYLSKSMTLTLPPTRSLNPYNLTTLGVTNTPSPLAHTTNSPSTSSSLPSFCNNLATNLTPLPFLSITSTSINTIPGVLTGATNSTVNVLVNEPVEVGVVLVVAACSMPHCKAIPILSSMRTAVMPPWRMCGCPFIPVPRLKRMFILSKVENPEAEEASGTV